jgi:hypothetical protein
MANGLINLKTDLTSLKYSSMPLGSDKPYVTKNIGQAPSGQLGMEVQHRIDDTSRIAQMLIDKPGIKYLLNEALLQQTDVADKIRNRGNKTVAGAVLGQLGNTLVGTAKILGSTLAQVPVNGTGLHFLKGFRTDTYLQGTAHRGFAQFFGAGGVEGAQYALQGTEVPNTIANNKSQIGESDGPDNYTVTKLSNYEYSSDSGSLKPQWDEKANTVLPTDSTTKTNAKSGTVVKVHSEGYQETTATKGDLAKYTTGSYGHDTLGIFEPETSTYSETKTYISASQNIRTFNKNVTKEYRVRLGDQGASISPEKQAARRLNDYSYMSNSGDEVDKLNVLLPQDGKVTGEREGRDIVKFRFHIITPDTTDKVLYFRAFLDSFNDNYTGTWNPTKYLGRAEDFQVYSGFQRKISLSFKIAAATRSEMKPIYQKMIWLASATAPSYSDNGQFMRGTIIKVTVGDYIYELPGVLNNLTYTWQQDYPWEIAMLEPESRSGDYNMQELPMVMDCQMDFTPIHTFTPEVGLKKYFTAGTRSENKYVPD